MNTSKFIGLVFILIFSTIFLNGQETDSLKSEPDLKKGLYLTSGEFFANNPSITDSFEIIETPRTSSNWEGTVSYAPKYFGPRKKVKKVYGFCDGEKQYVYHEFEYFEVETNGGEYSFWGYGSMKAPASDDAGDVLVTIAFGMAGYIIKGVIDQQKLKKIRQNYVIEPTNSIIYTRENYEKVGHVLVIYRKKRKENNTAVNIMVNDSLKYEMEKNSYYSILFKLSDVDVKICIEGKESCILLKPDSVTVKYLKVSNLLKSKEMKIEEVDWDQGEYESLVPYKKQKRKKRPKVNFGTF